jgi:hypothetical protein
MSNTLAPLQTIGRLTFQLAFETSPIFLTGGLANQLGTGAAFPIAPLIVGLSDGGSEIPGPKFMPIPGGTLNETDLATWPFANQATAGNATVSNPLHVSLQMTAPANSAGAYLLKLPIMTALKLTLDLHTSLGGTYTVLTPSYPYQNCILTRLSDISTGDTKQVQNLWQWDFICPLVTLSQAQGAQNIFMQKLTNGSATDGSLSGPTVASTQLSGF